MRHSRVVDRIGGQGRPNRRAPALSSSSRSSSASIHCALQFALHWVIHGAIHGVIRRALHCALASAFTLLPKSSLASAMAASIAPCMFFTNHCAHAHPSATPGPRVAHVHVRISRSSQARNAAVRFGLDHDELIRRMSARAMAYPGSDRRQFQFGEDEVRRAVCTAYADQRRRTVLVERAANTDGPFRARNFWKRSVSRARGS